jgi:hypothetical protein
MKLTNYWPMDPQKVVQNLKRNSGSGFNEAFTSAPGVEEGIEHGKNIGAFTLANVLQMRHLHSRGHRLVLKRK